MADHTSSPCLTKAYVLLLCLLPGIASCQKAALPPAPEVNPNPQQIVKITGRISPTLKVEMAAIYRATVDEGTCKPRMLVDGFLALDADDTTRAQDLVLAHGSHSELVAAALAVEAVRNG